MSHGIKNDERIRTTFVSLLCYSTISSIVMLFNVGTVDAQIARGNLGGEQSEAVEAGESQEPLDIGEGPTVPADIDVAPPTDATPPISTPPLNPPWDEPIPLVVQEVPEETAPTLEIPNEGNPSARPLSTTPPPATEGLPDNPWTASPGESAQGMTIPGVSAPETGESLPLMNPLDATNPPLMTTEPSQTTADPEPTASNVGVDDASALPPGGLEILPTDDVVTVLRKERYNEALDLYLLLEQDYENGLVDAETVLRAFRAFASAQLDLTNSHEERVRIRQAYLDACAQYLQDLQAKSDGGLVSDATLRLAVLEHRTAARELEQELGSGMRISPENNRAEGGAVPMRPMETIPSTEGRLASPPLRPETIAPGVVRPSEPPTYYGPGYVEQRPAPSVSLPPSPAPNAQTPCPCETGAYDNSYRSGVIYYSPSRARIRGWEQRVIGW